MEGWLKYSEIAYPVSDNPAGLFKPLRTILKGSGNKENLDCYSTHGAHIKNFAGKYYLYYSSSNPSNTRPDEVTCPQDTVWDRYLAGQRVGVAASNSTEDLIDGKFRRFSKTTVLIPDRVNTFGTVNNGPVTPGPDGVYYMIFNSALPDLSPTKYPMLEPTAQESDINNTDADLFECEGNTYVYYINSDQQTWGAGSLVMYAGSLKECLEGHFPKNTPMVKYDAKKSEFTYPSQS